MRKVGLVVGLLFVVVLGVVPSHAVTTVTLKMQNTAFNPPVFTMKTGDTLSLQNLDQFLHTFTAADGAAPTGLRCGGVACNVTVNENATVNTVVTGAPGPHAFRCTIHATMNGVVVITP
jgi:plastocyanin